MRVLIKPLTVCLAPWLAVFLLIFAVSCASSNNVSYKAKSENGREVIENTTLAQFFRQLNHRIDFIPKGKYARQEYRPAKHTYITLHSEFFDMSSAQLASHLKRGSFRTPSKPHGSRTNYLAWHYTVDESSVVQHLPIGERGELNDFNGPGNVTSINIMICFRSDVQLQPALERTAKLCAYLMASQKVPLRSVVPHYHWRRIGMQVVHKNCPACLLDNGRPGRKWKQFQEKVERYHRGIAAS